MSGDNLPIAEAHLLRAIGSTDRRSQHDRALYGLQRLLLTMRWSGMPREQYYVSVG